MIDQFVGFERTNPLTDLQPHVNASFHAVNERTHPTRRKAALYGSLPPLWWARRHCEDLGALEVTLNPLTHPREISPLSVYFFFSLWRLSIAIAR
jgi:hypothetical protein